MSLATETFKQKMASIFNTLIALGLEIKCTMRVEMIGTAVNQQIMDKYLELVKENYCEPEDELILGSFENCKDDLHIP